MKREAPTASGAACYKARLEGLTWDQVAHRCQVTGADPGQRALVLAQDHAKREGLPWPIDRPGPADKDFYDERARTGDTWLQIGERLGLSRQGARLAAFRYAQAQGLPWPLPGR